VTVGSSPAADLLVEDKDGVRCLTINRPDRANAIPAALAQRLVEEVAEADRDPEVRLLMITGEGDRIFSGGADLAEMSSDAAMAQPFRPIMPALYSAVLSMEKPTLAALNGTAAGGGLELALACDLRIAAAGARAGLPEIRYGMGATFGTVMLTRLLPEAVGLELVFSGDLVPVEDLARWGLFKVVPADRLRAASWAQASRLAAAAPLAVRKLKAIVRQGWRLPAAEAMRLQVGPDLYSSEDRREGLLAWREKRPPVWKGR
jgi:enoyl-CoA hydratase